LRKALAEYLETKHLAFPRFYFASSADLLDILSNGNHPLRVARCTGEMKYTSIKIDKFGFFSRHLTKLIGSLAHLTFKDVMGMILFLQHGNFEFPGINFRILMSAVIRLDLNNFDNS
jgi:hypothetical protein